MDPLDEYQKVNQHIEWSRMLFQVDQYGKDILHQFERKKYTRILRSGRSVFSGEIETIYNCFVDILNVKKLRYRLYFCLLYYLDDLMFSQIKHLEHFYTDEKYIELTRLYLCQDSWLKDELYGEKVSSCDFNLGQDLEKDDILQITFFLRMYENTLFTIQKITENHHQSTEINLIYDKINRNIGRIHNKSRKIWEILEKNILRLVKKN